MGSIFKSLGSWMQKALDDYGLVFAILCLGFILGWTAKTYLVDRKFERSIKERLKDKDKMIASLAVLVDKELAKINVPEEDAKFFKNVRKFFRDMFKKRNK